jgi:hypothetical protein
MGYEKHHIYICMGLLCTVGGTLVSFLVKENEI